MSKTVVVFAIIAGCLFLTCLPWHFAPCPPGWSGHWLGCGVFSFLIYVVLIGLVVYFIVKAAGTKRSVETPLDILKKRYAKGELTKDEFEKMKDDLRD